MRSTSIKKLLFLCLAVLLLPASSAAQIDSNSIRLQDEGTTQGQVKILNCVGAGIACTRSGATGTLTVGGGGSDPWTYLVLASDFNTTSASAVDVTGLSFAPVGASVRYEFRAILKIRTATAAVNPRVGLAWATGMTDGVASIDQSQSATTQLIARGSNAAPLLIAVGGLPNTTDSWPVEVKGIVITGSTPSGNMRIQLASETSGTQVTIKFGSFFAYRTY